MYMVSGAAGREKRGGEEREGGRGEGRGGEGRERRREGGRGGDEWSDRRKHEAV